MCTTTININKARTTQTFEDKVRQYAAIFAKKKFSEVESALFDDLYHNRVSWSRKEYDEQLLAAGAKITNLTYTRIDYNKALIQFCLESEGTADETSNSSSNNKSILLKFLVTIKDKKIIDARQIIDASQCSQNSSYNDLLEGRDIIVAYCLSDYHSIRRGYQHGEAAIFKGRSKGLLQH
jgi:hypothetical protein